MASLLQLLVIAQRRARGAAPVAVDVASYEALASRVLDHRASVAQLLVALRDLRAQLGELELQEVARLARQLHAWLVDQQELAADVQRVVAASTPAPGAPPDPIRRAVDEGVAMVFHTTVGGGSIR